METLFQFQIQTINKLEKELDNSDLLALIGEKGCGKSVLIENFVSQFHKCKVASFIGTPFNRYTDYGCFPKQLLKEYHDLKKIKKNFNSMIKDVSGITSLFTGISFANTLDALLSKDDRAEMESLINFFLELGNKNKRLFIFDEINNLDNKSLLFLYKMIALSKSKGLPNIKMLLILDTSTSLIPKIIPVDYLANISKIYIELPTDKDLEGIVDTSIYPIARHIPIKYLLELKSNCNNLGVYYNDKLNELEKENKYIKKIIFPLSLLDEEISVSNIIMFLSDLTVHEILHGLGLLEENNLIEKIEVDQDVYYKIPDIVKENLRKSIPEYIAINRYEVFVRQLEQTSPFDYLFKYKLYIKMRNYENAHANAILLYCTVTRGDILCSNENLVLIDDFLNTSSQSNFFNILKNAYKYYNQNDYNK